MPRCLALFSLESTELSHSLKVPVCMHRLINENCRNASSVDQNAGYSNVHVSCKLGELGNAYMYRHAMYYCNNLYRKTRMYIMGCLVESCFIMVQYCTVCTI